MGVARDRHRRCIYYPEHVYTWEGYSNRSVSYPSPTHSVCENIVVTLLVIPSTCIRDYPEHVYM